MAINKDDIKRIVEVFYQPPFKTFYINSTDGETFTKPLGVFVSLGITTSLKVMKNIQDILNNTSQYSAQIVEISSRKVMGQFLNTVTNPEPSQMQIPDIPTAKRMSKSQEEEFILDQFGSLKELETLRDFMYPDQDIKILQEYAPKIGTLEGLIDKLNKENGWEEHWISKKSSGEYKLFHRYINYSNMGDIEYRIGIYVTQK